MKGWEFASKDPTNINWSTAHSSEYMVSSKCWVWMAFNCVISVWTFKLWNTLGVVVGQVGCTRLAWLVCVTFVACIALIYAFKREGNRNAMSSEVTEREKERLMSARQIGAFRRRSGMNVRYTSKGFLHCGVCVRVCVCVCVLSSPTATGGCCGSDAGLSRLDRKCPPPIAQPAARLCKRRAEKERESYF